MSFPMIAFILTVVLLAGFIGVVVIGGRWDELPDRVKSGIKSSLIGLAAIVGLGIAVIVFVAAFLGPAMDDIFNDQPYNQRTLTQRQTELDEARALWESQGIQDYDVDVSYEIYQICHDISTAKLHVRDGEIAAITDHGLCEWMIYAPHEVFASVQGKLNSENTGSFTVIYDERYGLPTAYRYSYVMRSDSRASFEYSNFTPVEPGAPIEDN